MHKHWEPISEADGEVMIEVTARKVNKYLWKAASGWRKQPDFHSSSNSR